MIPLLTLILSAPAAGAASGAARVSPPLLTVDTKATIDYTYVVGEGGMAAGDRVRIEDPILHGMRWSKWAVDQLEPSACTPLSDLDFSYSLVTATTLGAAALRLTRSTVDPEIHEYAWSEVEVVSGALAPGEEIRVRYGDRSGGPDCGHQTPDRAYHNVPWRAYEWLSGQPTWQAVEPAPTFTLQPLPLPARVHVAAPSVVVAGERFPLTVAVLDRLGNPVEGWEGPVKLPDEYGGASAQLSAQDGGHRALVVQIDEPGVHRIQALAGTHAGVSNPIEVLAEAPEQRLYWGDIHTHHGHSYDDPLGRRVDENHVYARDVLGLQVGSESMKARPVEIGGEALWEELQESCGDYTEEGRYVALLGMEWMSADDGHHNLYFDSCEVPLADHDAVPRLAGRGGVFEWMDDLRAQGVRSVAVPHATMYTGHNWQDVDNERRTVAEIYSGWGSSMDEQGRPGTIPEALSGGNRVGFLAASDNHKGWMGNISSVRRFQPGLGAFWAPALSREAIYDALEQRRTYATTGVRILLRYWAEDGGRVEPGQDFAPEAPTFRWEVHGTDEIARVRLLAVEEGGPEEAEVLYEESVGDPDTAGSWTWAEVPRGDFAVYLAVEQVDGNRAWSSPIWLNHRGCGCAGEGSAAAFVLPAALLALARRRKKAGPVGPERVF